MSFSLCSPARHETKHCHPAPGWTLQLQAGDIYKQTAVEGLARISTRIKRLQQHLAAADQ